MDEIRPNLKSQGWYYCAECSYGDLVLLLVPETPSFVDSMADCHIERTGHTVLRLPQDGPKLWHPQA